MQHGGAANVAETPRKQLVAELVGRLLSPCVPIFDLGYSDDALTTINAQNRAQRDR
jgi:hypothetical protein